MTTTSEQFATDQAEDPHFADPGLLQSLLDSAFQGLMALRPVIGRNGAAVDLVWTVVNAGGERFLGRPRAALLGASFRPTVSALAAAGRRDAAAAGGRHRHAGRLRSDPAHRPAAARAVGQGDAVRRRHRAVHPGRHRPPGRRDPDARPRAARPPRRAAPDRRPGRQPGPVRGVRRRRAAGDLQPDLGQHGGPRRRLAAARPPLRGPAAAGVGRRRPDQCRVRHDGGLRAVAPGAPSQPGRRADPDHPEGRQGFPDPRAPDGRRRHRQRRHRGHRTGARPADPAGHRRRHRAGGRAVRPRRPADDVEPGLRALLSRHLPARRHDHRGDRDHRGREFRRHPADRRSAGDRRRASGAAAHPAVRVRATQPRRPHLPDPRARHRRRRQRRDRQRRHRAEAQGRDAAGPGGAARHRCAPTPSTTPSTWREWPGC